MKKILGIFLLLQLLWIPNVYAEELPTISVGSFDAYIGEKIVVPITIENNPGCSYLGIHVYYDMNSLEYVDSKLKGLENADTKDIVRSEDMITLYAMAYSENKSMNDNGVIAELTFNVKENAMTSTLRIEVTDFGGEDLVDYKFIENEGIVRINDKKAPNTKEDLTQSIPSYTEGDVTWKSSDENIATINEQGEVTFSNEGTTTITGTDSEGNVVVEKDYKVVDDHKENQQEEKKVKDKESKKDNQKENQKETTPIYILITIGILFIVGCIIILVIKLKKNKKNKANSQ